MTVDLSGLTFIDSAGLQTLFRFHQQMEKQGSWVALRGAQDIVLRVLQITGLDAHLEANGGAKPPSFGVADFVNTRNQH